MKYIPKIIHQIWSGKHGPIPEKFAEFTETWKIHHPDWEYMLWDEDAMNRLTEEEYPQYKRLFDNLPFDIQRWDVARYLILLSRGGLYADMDYQCLKPFHNMLDQQTCCLGMEPASHFAMAAARHFCIGNALMACISGHPFFQELVQAIFKQNLVYDERMNFLKWIVATTGPVIVTDTYFGYADRKSILLLSNTLVAPFSKMEAIDVIKDPEHERWRHKIKNAMAIHYFTGTWLE
ncbi:MAG: hypothetical protein LBV02_06590 [Bacteroidales bacterium]|jgi:mannosyltransferase OCH1-like enzyme|nr:hypothetical protein [Bacteroidales bacterium]